MRVAVFSTKPYDERFFIAANRAFEHDLVFFDAHLTARTVGLASGFAAVCAFVNDQLNADVLGPLARGGTKLIALRCAGFNNVDLTAAQGLGITVARVPAYSPYAVAEHTLGLVLSLNRKLHRAYNRVREGNFALDGLLGFDLHGKTVGVIGTGRIGLIFAQLMAGLGCRVLACDPSPSPDAPATLSYVSLPELLAQADIISLHCPLAPATHHIIDATAILRMKPGVMLINTSRGALVDTSAVIQALKTGHIGYLGLDVYEEEADLFFEDLSDRVLQDDVFARLLTFPNVIITGHQAFFTAEALANIAETTLQNLATFETGAGVIHRVAVEHRGEPR